MFYVSLIIFILLCWFLYQRSRDLPLKSHFFPSLLLKIAAGIGVGLIYFNYYSEGDTILYHNTAKLIIDYLGHNLKNWSAFLFRSDLPDYPSELPRIFNEPRSLFFVKILSFLYVFSGQSYWVAGLYLSVFSFFGAWFIANSITKYYPELRIPSVIAFLYLPGVVFWSSGILKESIAYPCIMLIVSGFIFWYRDKKINYYQIFLLLILFFMLWKIKYHYAALLFVTLFAAFIYQRIYVSFFKTERAWVFFVILTASALVMTLAHPNFNISVFFKVISENHRIIKSISEPENHIHFIYSDGSLKHFLINIPVSLTGGLFLPLPWQGNNWLIHLTGFVNLAVLIIFIIKCIHIVRNGLVLNVISYSLFFYILVSAILMAYSSPNFGTLERYKISYMSFFVLWIIPGTHLVEVLKNFAEYKSLVKKH